MQQLQQCQLRHVKLLSYWKCMVLFKILYIVLELSESICKS